MKNTNKASHLLLEEIYKNDASDLQKLRQAFDHVTQIYLDEYHNEVQIHQATQDQEQLIKAQIQYGMMQSARGIFNHNYYKITGEQAFGDEK